MWLGFVFLLLLLLPLVPLNSFFKLKTFHKIKLRDMSGEDDEIDWKFFLSICCSSTVRSTRCYSSSEIYKIIIKRFSTVTANNFSFLQSPVQNERRKFSSGEKSNRIVTNSISTNWLRLNLYFFFLFLSHSLTLHSLIHRLKNLYTYIAMWFRRLVEGKKISISSDNLLQIKLVDAITRRWFFHFCVLSIDVKKKKKRKSEKYTNEGKNNKNHFFVLLSHKKEGERDRRDKMWM